MASVPSEVPASTKRKQQLKEIEQKFEQNIGKIFKRKPKAKKNKETFESIEQVKVFSLASKTHSGKSSQLQFKRRQATYWLLCTWIGILVGIFAYLSHEGLVGIQGFRIWLARLFMQWVKGPGGVFLGWAVYSLSSIAVVLIGGCLCIFVQPMARGGGIAETKAFLNGVNIPGLFQLRTLFIKLISVICAVGGGLAVGQEGPMIHIGAMIAWNMSQMKFSSIPKVSYLFRKFQNDKDKRDFVTSGASMGVSAAFSAPIGGTLFGLEEASSFWSHALIWRSFWGCMVATFTASFLVKGSKSGLSGLIQQPTQVMYSVPIGHGYRLYEIFPFILLAIIGGILGGIFIKLNFALNKWRKQKYYTSNRNKVIELAVIAMVTASCSILLPMAFHCQSNSLATAPANVTTTATVIEDAVNEMAFEIYNCADGEYNPLASLWFTSAELTLKHLFVREAPMALGYGPLITFSVLYFCLACFTAGTWIAAGLLVPMLIMGAAFGRLFGVILNSMFPLAGLDPGIYALLGATAFMGGVTRMTISLVVIILEITHDMEALLPIMLVAVVAKWTGDMFGHSLYDEQLHIANMPFLEWDPPRISHVMVCKEAMETEYPQLEEVDSVANIFKVIREENIGNVPVVQKGEDGFKLKGSIPKLHLKVLLANRAFESDGLIDVNSVRKFKEEPRWEFTAEEMALKIDLKPYTNLATFSIKDTFPLSICYKIFRAQGLRHMFVVNQYNVLVGVIMREHLLLHDDKFHHHGKGHSAANMHSHASEQDLLHHNTEQAAQHSQEEKDEHFTAVPLSLEDEKRDESSVHVQLDDDEEIEMSLR